MHQWEAEVPGLAVWDAGTPSGSPTCCATMLTPKLAYFQEMLKLSELVHFS